MFANDVKKTDLSIKSGLLNTIKSGAGFTMIEMVTVITVLAIMTTLTLVIFNPRTQLERGNDAKRMSDLTQIHTSLDTYYDNNNKYPQGLDSLDSSYMQTLPRDPSCGKTGTCNDGYMYLTDESTTSPQWFILFAKLKGNLNPTNKCPYTCTGAESYNYCTYSGVIGSPCFKN